MDRIPSLLLLLALAGPSIVHPTAVTKCKDTKLPPPKDEDVKIAECQKPPCRLRKRTEPSILMKIKPEKDVEGIITRVNAEIATIPFPFIGVDGTTACGNIYSEDGKNKVGCPLKSGVTYLYKNSFKILEIYPKFCPYKYLDKGAIEYTHFDEVKVNIHWGLVNNKTREYISCFQVLASIG